MEMRSEKALWFCQNYFSSTLIKQINCNVISHLLYRNDVLLMSYLVLSL